MVFRLIIKPLAYLDIDEAIAWYEVQQKDLGKLFYKTLEKSLAKIIQNPYHYSFYFKGVRRHLMEKFPYRIFYIIEQEKVIVIGVYHGKRSKSVIERRFNFSNE